MKRIVISALAGSSGKTLVTLGLMRAFSLRGLKVRAFKKGPDYIDAAWHALASGRTACNLDLFFMSPESLKELFLRRMLFNYEDEDDKHVPCDLAIIEGNRGLFDGLDIHGSCSTASVARALKAPVVLIINATKMTRTIAALVNGCANFEKDLNLAGVIANRTGSKRHGALLASCIKTHCKTPFLGYLPRLAVNPILERNTGLASLAESAELEKTLNELAGFVEQHLDLDELLNIATKAEKLETTSLPAKPVQHKTKESAPSIGYIYDSCFWYLYPENLEALKETGAKLVPLQLLDYKNWGNINGLYIPGGSVESFIETLHSSPASQNNFENWLEMTQLLKKMSLARMPIYAEGTAAWLLAQQLVFNNNTYQMSGILPFNAVHSHQKRGLGYVMGEAQTSPFFQAGAKILGHEFNYTKWELQGKDLPDYAYKLSKGTGLYQDIDITAQDGFFIRNTQGSSTQIHASANPDWAKEFYKLALSFKQL